MHILIDINHPAHVHLCKYLYWELLDRGHKVYITIKDIDSVISLLDHYDIKYINLGKKKDSILGKAVNQVKYDAQLFRIVKKYDIDIGISSSISLPHISKFTKMSSIVMDDDDDVVEPLFVKFGHPFSNVILTPNSIKRKSLNTIYYNGCHELAYLHPNRYKPDPCVLREAGVNQGDKYFVLRFNSFKAHHDIDAEGLSLDNKLELVNHLKDKGKVFITTEGEIEPEFSQYKLKITSDRIHSLIYYATMFIGDSQTMTSESAILGTPALKCNSFAGRLSVPNQIEKYGLCYSFLPEHFYKMMQKIKNLINLPNLKQEWQIRRDKMLKDKIDVTSFYVWFVENYPESYKIMKENPDYQYNFK